MLADFKKLMSARFLYTFGIEMQGILIGWRMYELTHDPLFLGLIGLAEAIPALSLALYAGYRVDRSRPLRVYKGVVFGALLSAALLLGSQFSAFDLGTQEQIVALFASSLISGAVRAFSQPSMYAIVPRILPREQLARASAWMGMTMQVARISGPALGGLLFGWWGLQPTAVVICLTLLLAQGALAVMKTSPPAQQKKAGESMKEEILSGASFVFRHPILLPALSLDMVSVLFGGVTALLPIYASDILQVGAKGLGILRAAPAVGAALTSFWLIRTDIRAKAGPWLFTAVTGFGVCILVFAVSRDFVLSSLALGFSGAFDSVSMMIRSSAVQLSSPDSMRGRISAVNSIFIGSSNEIGEFESGVAARLLGTVPAAVFGGVVCLLTVAAVAILSPTLRRLDLRRLEEGGVSG